jgi:flavin-dependent dehydrogenase
VVGAGAAGTMAAIWAASAGADTVLLESTADGGR